MQRFAVAVAGIAGAVSLGAAAALRHVPPDNAQAMEWGATAARLGLLHAAVLVGLTAPMGDGGVIGVATMRVALWCFAAGLLLFCGSLWLLAFGAPHLIVGATPVGGSLLIAGWAALAIGALARRPG